MSEWTSVNDRMPEQGDFVDGWVTNHGRITNVFWDRPARGSDEMYWACYDGSDPFYTGGLVGGVSFLDVTHWMLPPDAPVSTGQT